MLEKNLEKWIVGSALAIAATALLPIAKTTFRPFLATGNQGWSKAKSGLQFVKEEFEDIVAEAKFERMKKQFDRDMEVD